MLDFGRFKEAREPRRRTIGGLYGVDDTRAETLREQPDEAQMLGESLRQCQEELARVRAAQEALMEELAEERALRMQVERRSTRLAEIVDELHLSLPSGTGLATRIRRRIARVRLARAAEWREVAVVESSALFSSAWYVRRYPDVVASGLPPALHYVRKGAGQGKDPSDRFSTSKYLRAHPEVKTSGENPLVHYLRTDRSTARGR